MLVEPYDVGLGVLGGKPATKKPTVFETAPPMVPPRRDPYTGGGGERASSLATGVFTLG